MDAKKAMRCITAVATVFLMLSAVLLSGCAVKKEARNTAEAQQVPSASTDARMITAIHTVDNPDAVDLFIDGNQLLTYTSVRQPLPLKMVLYFPETRFAEDLAARAADNEIIGGVTVIRPDDSEATSRLEISLKKDIPCTITRAGSGLKLSFPKSLRLAAAQESSPAADVQTEAADAGATKAADLQKKPAAVEETDLADDARKTDAPEAVTPKPSTADLQAAAAPKETPPKAVQPETAAAAAKPATDKKTAAADSEPQSAAPQTVAAEKPPAPETLPAASASHLESISAQPGDRGIAVKLTADGTITHFKTFTLKNPPRIVYDIPNLKSPYQHEQRIVVDTPWVKRIRHYGNADKLRLVLDTEDSYLSDYAATPARNGLLIRVGAPASTAVAAGVQPIPTAQQETPVAASPEPPVVARAETQAVAVAEEAPAGRAAEMVAQAETRKPDGSKTAAAKAVSKATAWLDQLDFTSEELGKSTITIGTTRAVEYKIQQEGKRHLVISLPNVKIPDYRKRPLITTRFASAVDRIIPIQTAKMKKRALISIELREAVPHRVEQKGRLLLVHFGASSIPPKPFEDANLPAWEQVAKTTIADIDQKIAAVGSAAPTAAAAAAKGAAAPAKATGPHPIMRPVKKYTGEKIALDFFETDIKNVFRILRQISGKNFAIDQDVTGKVTLSLEKPVPWDQVLDLVLKMNQLGMVKEGDIIRIGTLQTFRKEEELKRARLLAEQKTKEQKKDLAPLVTEYIEINYSNAKNDILPHLQQILTKDRGQLSVDERTNQIIMTDTAPKIQQAREIVARLDRVTPQVGIEARIVEATTSFAREIGVQWGVESGIASTGTQPYSASRIGGEGDSGFGTAGDPSQPSFLAGSGAPGTPGVGPQRGFDTLGGTYGWDTAVNLPASLSAGAIGFNFLRIAGTPFLLNAKLMAAESQGETKIISAPKIVTMDNVEALIKQGVRYPYNKLDESGNTVTEFEDIDLVLTVTPHVTLDHRISLRLHITKKDLGDVILGQQSFTNKEAQTELLVNDGDTVVIGGIIKSRKSVGEKGLPFLSKVPLLGWLFKNHQKSDDKEELLIFITPRIVQLESRSRRAVSGAL